jgi:hypothetical protein
VLLVLLAHKKGVANEKDNMDPDLRICSIEKDVNPARDAQRVAEMLREFPKQFRR